MNIQLNRKSHLMRALLGAVVLAGGLGFGATAANATITSSVGGVPTSAEHYESFDSCDLGSGICSPPGTDLTVSFMPAAQVVNGAADGLYAAPFLSNNNGVLFGDPENTADTTNYLTSGSTGSAADAGVTLTFTTSQRYLGLLWGSVDAYNTLTFYMDGVQVDQFTGANVSDSAGTGNCVGGKQGMLGTCYVNINLTNSFNSVVATSSEFAFEFDNVAYSATPIGVPEPGIAGIFLLGLLLVGTGYWLKGRRLA